ncbi:MAG: hypothetical protein ABSA83_16800 [Verrucomicrobiota bacterium]
MKKLITSCLAAAALASLSACSSTNGTNATPTTSTAFRPDSGPQSQVAFPDNFGTTTRPTATPNLPGSN